MAQEGRYETIASARRALDLKDFQTVVDLMTPLANAGDAEAQYILGYLYLTEFEEMPAEDSFNWFVKAAKQDHPEACYHLFTFPESIGFVSPLDDAERVALLIKAGELGSVGAQYHLGAYYATGDWPGPKDETEAIKWYTKAAEQGDAEAQYNLGFMLLEGEGGRQNSHEGIAWLDKAVDRGHDQARRLLADIYARGLYGVTKDPVVRSEGRDEASE